MRYNRPKFNRTCPARSACVWLLLDDGTAKTVQLGITQMAMMVAILLYCFPFGDKEDVAVMALCAIRKALVRRP